MLKAEFNSKMHHSRYPASKSLMTIKHCFWHAGLVSFSSFYISSNITVSLRNLIIFSTSQFFPSSVHMLPWILYFFLLSLSIGGSLVGNVINTTNTRCSTSENKNLYITIQNVYNPLLDLKRDKT